MENDRRPTVEYFSTSSGWPEPPVPGWFDYHPEVPAIALIVVVFAAFIAVHFTRNEPHEWAMCCLFTTIVWAGWGIIVNSCRLIRPLTESNAGAFTALVLYIGVAIGQVLLMMNPIFLEPLNYAGN